MSSRDIYENSLQLGHALNVKRSVENANVKFNLFVYVFVYMETVFNNQIIKKVRSKVRFPKVFRLSSPN